VATTGISVDLGSAGVGSRLPILYPPRGVSGPQGNAETRASTGVPAAGGVSVRIHHINAYLEGGAAVAARRLHEGLLAEGVQSCYWHADSTSFCGPGYRQLPWGMPGLQHPWHAARASLRWVHERLLRTRYRKGKPQRSGMYSGPVRPYDTPLTDALADCDLLHLHWVSQIIDYRSFFASMPPDLPLVWTLHDMQPITGACHQAFDCERFQQGCGECPILGQPGPRDISARDHAIKRQALQGRQLQIVTPSYWLERLARVSGVLPQGCAFHTIRNGISLEQFYPVEKSLARRELGLPADGLIVAYAAASLANIPKGVQEFLRAISQLPARCGVTGLVFGKDRPPAGLATVPLVNLGFLTDPARQRLAFSAADIFALPSHAETISQTAVEALACGTPVVASDVGGVPEVVRDGITGLLARPRDPDDLARAMLTLADDPSLRARMAAAGEAVVREEFEAVGQVRRCLKLYESCCGSAALPAGSTLSAEGDRG
jgi:glycosyltransferase involved in cell wall biosynthesis